MEGEIAARNKLIKYSFIVVLSIFSLLFFVTFVVLIPLVSRAASNTLTLKIRAQGLRKEGDTVKVHIDFYDGPDKAGEENDVVFTYKDEVLTGVVPFRADFDFGKAYALFIKPEKYAGKLFCGVNMTGAQCAVPQLRFLPTGSDYDFSKEIFLSGDIVPMDGKVDASDISNIMKNLGRLSSDGFGLTDINNDGITDVVDYSLAFYSLSNNAKDDAVSLTLPVPTATPTPVPSLTPSPTLTPTPTPIPTATPAPSATPVPTATPIPTSTPIPTPTVKVAHYDRIAAMVEDRPQIGCPNGTVNNCPVTQLYNTPVEKGLGWATYYGPDHGTGNVTAEVIHNNKGISWDAAYKFIDETYMARQSDMTPEEAKKTGKVIAYAATRTPKDLWRIKYMFGIDDPAHPKPYFIGRIMVIDCAADHDWNPRLATLTYGYKGWTSPPLNWIVDLSVNGFTQIPTGYSGRQDNVGEGRPGVVLIDESVLDDIIY